MKPVIALKVICLILFTSRVFGGEVSDFGIAVSEKTNGLSIAIGPTRNMAPILDSDKLCWCPYSDIGKVELLYPTPPFGIRVNMLAPNGVESQRTLLGRSFGSKFSKLQRPNDSRLGCRDAEWPFDRREAQYGISGPVLFAPSELFVMKEPGTYTLEIQMQMFKRPAADLPEMWRSNLICFPTVKLRIVKPGGK